MIPLSLPVPMADVANHLGFLFFFLVDVGLVLGFLRSSVLKATSANEAWSAPEREPLCDSRCGPLHSVSVTLGVIQPVLVSSQVWTELAQASEPECQSETAACSEGVPVRVWTVAVCPSGSRTGATLQWGWRALGTGAEHGLGSGFGLS